MSASTVAEPASNVAGTPPISAPTQNRVTPKKMNLTPCAAAEPSQLEVKLVSTIQELEAIDAQWQFLADNTLEANPFYEPWMVLPALRTLGDEPKPVFALVYGPHPCGDKSQKFLYGFFPLTERRFAKGAPTMLSLWKHAYCYLATPLLVSTAARQTLAAFFDWLEKSGRLDNAVLRLQDVCGRGLFRQILVDELHARGWPNQVSQAYTRALFIPEKTAEQYMERALSGRRRRETKKHHAKLSELGEVTITMNDALDTWIPEFVELEARGWKGRKAVAVAAAEREKARFEMMCREAHARGKLMTLTLRLDGKPIAMKLNLFGADGGFAFKITYDEAFAKLSPGVLLEVDHITRLHQLPELKFMDSCAAPNRFMINDLWPDRREIQTVLVTSHAAAPSLLLSLVPVAKWARRQSSDVVADARAIGEKLRARANVLTDAATLRAKANALLGRGGSQ